MIARAETAAATRRALLEAAAELLDEGGPDAATLRAVGARAGVSRGAPYGHFADKEDLLAAVAVERWERLAEELVALRAESRLSAPERLRAALTLMLDVARRQPHLHALMFTAPQRDPESLARAAIASQDEFLAIVAEVVGGRAARSMGALLLSSTLGVAGMERAGQLDTEKWGVSGDDLIKMLADLARASSH